MPDKHFTLPYLLLQSARELSASLAACGGAEWLPITCITTAEGEGESEPPVMGRQQYVRTVIDKITKPWVKLWCVGELWVLGVFFVGSGVVNGCTSYVSIFIHVLYWYIDRCWDIWLPLLSSLSLCFLQYWWWCRGGDLYYFLTPSFSFFFCLVWLPLGLFLSLIFLCAAVVV